MPAGREARVRTRLPLQRRWSVLFRMPGGELGELDLVWATPAAWRRLPQSRDPAWRLLRLGPFLLALKVLL